jgi:ferritin-like metal-binding protein YciE
MATTRREEVIDWLHDAYAMERGLEVTLRKQAENEDVQNAVRVRMRIHLDETAEHANRLQRCLEMLGSAPPAVKSAAGQVMEMGKGFASKFTRDERVKDFLGSYSAECFEVACYKSLIAGARAAGEEKIVPLLKANLGEDKEMAEWLDMNVEPVTREYLFHSDLVAATG